MKKTLAVVVATAVLASLLGAAEPASAQDEMTSVIVTLRVQADLPDTTSLEDVIRTLKSTATDTQTDLRADLRDLRSDGSVEGFTPLWVFNAISVTATADVISELAARPEIASVTTDEVRIVPSAAPAEPNIDAVHAPAVWDQGFSGQGVTVATLDSGVDVTNPDLAARWRGGANSWYDPYAEHTTPTDLSGHGTATMSVIVGAEDGGTSIGMAPGANWIAAKIFDDSGAATATAVHQSFQWVLDPDHNPNTNDAPRVVNGSWSVGSGPGCDLSFQPDVQALRAAGILPVFAAGNFGPGGSSSVSPANYPEALAVGAVDNSGGLYAASGRGPSTCGGRTGVFPDLVAPGVNVRTADRYGFYQTLSGTSIAAPHAAGALTLLLSARPDLTADQQATALRSGAGDLGAAGPDDDTGAGMLDVAAAYALLPPPATDAAPPAVTVSAPAAPVGQAGYFAAGQVPVTVSVTSSDPSGIASVSCLDGTTVLVPSPEPTGNPTSATGSLSIAEDGTHTITCAATDGLGNGPGADAGSANTATVLIDAGAPTVSAVQASPNPTNTTTSNATSFTQSATGQDPTSGVAGAEWYEGADPGAGNGVVMSAGDGSFGDLTEGVLSTVDFVARAWTAGNHQVSVRVRDAAGNWSAPAATTVGVVLPNDVFADGFESGAFGAWSGTGGNTNRIAVTPGSSEGTYKMAATISGGTSGYVQDDRPLADVEYHARFSLNPNGYTTGNGSTPAAVDVFRAWRGPGAMTLQVQYRRSSKVGSQIRLVVTRSHGTTATNWFALSDNKWNAVEIDWRAGRRVSAHLYVKGTLRATLKDMNTAAWTVEAIRLGPQGPLPNKGTMFFDSFSSTRRTVI